MTQLRYTGLFLLTLVLGCGNPHLTRKALESSTTPIVEAKSVKLTDSDGNARLDIVTNLPAENDSLDVARPADTLIVEYRFEKGEHFRFKGGSFPGEAGTCQLDNPAQANCLLDIEFFADEVGLYRDNLIVTYALRSNPASKQVVTIPLTGERIGDGLRPLEVTSTTSETGLDVKTAEDSIDVPLSVRNPNLEATVTEYKFEKGEHFRFNGGSFPGTDGTCASPQAATSSCVLDIEFFATTPGIYQDNLVVTSYLVSQPENKKVLLIPLRGERTRPVNPSLQVISISGSGSLDFGTANVGGPVRKDRIVIRNTGDVEQTIDIKLEKGAPFSLTENCPETLAALKSCEIIVSYNSSVVGTHTDFVVVTHALPNGDRTTVQKIPVIGITTGWRLRPGVLQLSGNDLDFGKVAVGGESVRTIELRNTGELPVNLSDINLTGTSFSFSGPRYPGVRGTCGRLILTGMCKLEIRFTPGLVGQETGLLVLKGEAGEKVQLRLRGEGTQNGAEVCHAEEEVVVTARPNSDRTGMVLPYNLKARGSKAKLSVLYGTATNSYVKSLKRYTVKDAQVYVSYDIPRLRGEIVEMSLQVDIAKVIREDYKDTESLCLTSDDVKKCSGREFSVAGWKALRNPSFWSKEATPVTTTYEDDFSAVESQCGRYTCYGLSKTFDAKQIFALSSSELAKLADHRLSFIFSDDTRLRSMPVLKFKVKKPVSCRRSN